ncbi:MAG: hypothetical protein IH996_09085 [Proteobacteria bacterium]|nr:hypothetical protein [Pseudomonadota bacterium]
MKTSIKVISLCTAVFLGLVWATTPVVAAQAAEKVQTQPQKAPSMVGNMTFEHRLLAKPTNTKAEAQTLLAQMRTASAELKELVDQNQRPQMRRRTAEKAARQRREYQRSSERLRHKERAVAHRESIETIRAVATRIDAEIVKWEQKLSAAGDDAQLANIDLQNMLQKQQQTLQTISNVSKMLHDTAMAIIRKIG